MKRLKIYELHEGGEPHKHPHDPPENDYRKLMPWMSEEDIEFISNINPNTPPVKKRQLVFGEPGFKEQQRYLNQQRGKLLSPDHQLKLRLRDSITPIGYDVKHAAKEFIAGKRLPFIWDGKQTTFDDFDKLDRWKNPETGELGWYGKYVKDASKDAWNIYLGFDQESDTYKPSFYQPSNSKNKSAKYYSFNYDDDIWDEAINNKVLDLKKGKSKYIKDSASGGFTLQNYKLGKGYDSELKLPYISYYDKNDYNIDLGAFGNIKGEDIVGEAFEVYGRMYYDPKTKKRVFPEPKINKKEGGFIEIELTDEEAEKYRTGGYILEEMDEGGGGTYTVKSGDTFDAIAYANGINPSELRAANPGISYGNLSIGQVINIPEKKAVAKPATKIGKTFLEKLKFIANKPIYDDYFTSLMFQENSVKKGWNPKTQLWMPAKAPEKGGGFDIGFGHKIQKGEDFSKGITNEEAIDLMKKDFEKKKKNASKYIDKTYGEGTFESLPVSKQVLLTDYEYNVKGGIGTFKNFAKGVVNDDKDLMLKEYIRYSDGEPLGERNKFTEDWINKYFVKQSGGFIEIDLSEKEAQMYADGGYVVEELPSYKPGGGVENNPLTMWNLLQKDRWSNQNENTKKGKEILKEYNKNIGKTYNPNDAWSAITISNAVISGDSEGFRPTKSHSSYVTDAFKTNANPDYKYNKFIAQKPDGDYNVGDILVKGRQETANWSFDDFASHGKGYRSHGDIVVDKGSDDKGDYIILAGGNLSNTYKNKKVYLNNMDKSYKVKLKDTKPSFSMDDASVTKTTYKPDPVNDAFMKDFNWTPYRNRSTAAEKEEDSFFKGYPNPQFSTQAVNPNTGVLGIGYIPYSYQFPDLDLKEEAYQYQEDDTPIDVLQKQIDQSREDQSKIDVPETPTSDKQSETETKTKKETEEESKEFTPRVYDGKEVYKAKYSKKWKDKISAVEKEISNLENERLNEIKKLSSAEMSNATTDEEKAAAKLKEFKSIMSMAGMNVAGDDSEEIKAITEKYKKKKEELQNKLKLLNDQADNSLLNEGKVTVEQLVDVKEPGYNKASKDYDKNIEKGLVWNSWAKPESEEEIQAFNNLGFINMPYLGTDQSVASNSWKRNSTENLYKNLDPDFGKFYGDGSTKYGYWTTPKQVEEYRQKMANAEYRSKLQDPLGMGQSGRVSMWYPELNLIPAGLTTKLANLAFELGFTDNPDANFLESYWLSDMLGSMVPSDFISGATENISDFFTTTFGKKKPGEKGYGEYQKAVERQKEVDKAYNQQREIMKSIAGTNRLSGSQPTLYNKDGGIIYKSGGTVSSIWKERTGTPWSEAKAQGLTDGSYDQNVALRKRLLQGEFDSDSYKSTPSEEREKQKSFDYERYDRRIRERVAKGQTLDDLVNRRLGTRKGLISRFPDLFGETKEVEVADLTDKEVKELEKEGYTVEETTDENETTVNPSVSFAQFKNKLINKYTPSSTKSFGKSLLAQAFDEYNRPKGLEFNIQSNKKETISPFALTKMKMDMPVYKSKSLYDPNKSFSENYDEFTRYKGNEFDFRSKKEKEIIKKAGQKVEDEINALQQKEEESREAKAATKMLNKNIEKIIPIDDEASGLASTVAQRIGSYVPEKTVISEDKYGPELMAMLNRANQARQEESIPVYVDPITGRNTRDRSVQKLVNTPIIDNIAEGFVGAFNTTGEFIDAATGLPKKIYEGVAAEVEDVVDKIQKTSILPGYITDDAEALYNFGSSIVNKDYEALIDNKYGQKLALKILDQNENPNKYMGLRFKTLSNEEQQWLRRGLEKAGALNTPDEKLEVVKEKVIKETPKPETFIERTGDVKDSYDPKYKLMAYRNQWDNNEGFVYRTAPTKQHRKNSDTYENVLGVAHFLLDASVDPKNPYSHKNNISYIERARANNDWIPAFENVSDNEVRLKYKKPEDLLETDIVSTPLRQLKFSDIDFKTNQTPVGFKKSVREVTTKDGQGTYLLFKNRDGYSRFSGGSVVFIFEDKYGNTIVRDFAGSLNSIQREGNSISKQYELEPGELTIGYHDVGSFSAKPKADSNNVLKADQWKGYNNNGYTGGALLIPASK